LKSILKKPTAWLPLAMSLAALIFIFTYVAIFGIVYHEDEGTPAHIFQLLMLAQIPIIIIFAILWLPRAPKQALAILVLQILAAMLPVITVMLLENRV
jgi:glucan phosphoethanolaminetransferase (alkaline phosphatase superfamily)